MPLCLFMIRWHFPIFTDKINNMEYQIIPIESIKRIETWLTTETGFSRSMLHCELDYISDGVSSAKEICRSTGLVSVNKERGTEYTVSQQGNRRGHIRVLHDRWKEPYT